MLRNQIIMLRAIEKSDLASIAAWRSDSDAYDFFYEFLPTGERQQEIWYEKQLANQHEINLIIALTDGTAIGMIGIYDIDRRNRKAEWGRLIIGDKAHRGKGLGKAALALLMEYGFGHLNMHKLYCEVFKNNIKACTLYKKLGFKEEGIRREHAFKNGRYVDAVLLSILENEYFHEQNHVAVKDLLENPLEE